MQIGQLGILEIDTFFGQAQGREGLGEIGGDLILGGITFTLELEDRGDKDLEHVGFLDGFDKLREEVFLQGGVRHGGGVGGQTF